MKRMLAWSSGSPGPPPDGCLSSRSLVPATWARLRFSLVYTEDAVEGYLFGPSALSISLSNMPDISSWENLEELCPTVQTLLPISACPSQADYG